MKKAYLYLENGQVLEGHSFGAAGTAMGELVFTTGTVSYTHLIPWFRIKTSMRRYSNLGSVTASPFLLS